MSYSFNSASSISPKLSLAKVLKRRSDSSVPRFLDWYTNRARSLSTDSFGRGRGVGGGRSEGVVVDARCSGVWGNGHGSFDLSDVAVKFRAVDTNMFRRTALRRVRLSILFCRGVYGGEVPEEFSVESRLQMSSLGHPVLANRNTCTTSRVIILNGRLSNFGGYASYDVVYKKRIKTTKKPLCTIYMRIVPIFMTSSSNSQNQVPWWPPTHYRRPSYAAGRGLGAAWGEHYHATPCTDQ